MPVCIDGTMIPIVEVADKTDTGEPLDKYWLVMKKILIFSPYAFQNYGHGADYVSGLVEGFKKNKVIPSVLAFEGPQTLRCQCQYLSVPYSNLKRLNKGTRPYEHVLWGLRRVKREIRITNILKQLSIHRDYHHIILESFDYFSILGAIKNKGVSNRYSCIFHDTNFNTNQTSRVAAIYKYLAKFPAIQIVKNSKVAFVHGKSMRSNLIRSLSLSPSLSDKIVTIPHGAREIQVDQLVDYENAKKKLELPEDKRVLLSFGTYRRDKNYDMLFSSFKEIEGWLLVIAGPEGDVSLSELRALVEKFGIGEKIKIINGFIPLAEHGTMFGAADIVITLYKDLVVHDSGTAQNARGFLRPVVVGGPADLTEYVVRNKIGWQMDYNDPGSLKRILDTYSAYSREDIEDLQDCIRRCAEERSWKNVTAKIILHSGIA